MIKLNVNGKLHEVDVDENTPLLWVLRDHLQLTGTKYGCGIGQCGACSVILGGQSVRSCSLLVGSLVGQSITTIEGLTLEVSPVKKAAKRVQLAWQANNVPQCGYCQPGQVVSATALLAEHPNASDSEIDKGMVGNLCRCGTYPRIKSAIKEAQEGLSSE